MPPKKRKFDFDDVEKRFEEVQRVLCELKETVKACSLSTMSEFMDTDELLSYAAFRFGFGFVQNVVSALSVVPDGSGVWWPEITKSLNGRQ